MCLSVCLSSFLCTFVSFVSLRFVCFCSSFIMRPSSLGGGRILRRTLSVCLSVRPVIYRYRASRGTTQRITMTHNHTCTFRLAQRAAYRTAISAAQTCLISILIIYFHYGRPAEISILLHWQLVTVHFFLSLHLFVLLCTVDNKLID